MPTVNKEIKNLRADIDRLDQKILKLLKQRIHVTQKIGKIKKSNRSNILDTQRESEIIANLLETGENLKIKDDFIVSLWRQIIEYSYKVQNDCE
jgi:monofunctional chorismate mutase